MPIAPALQRFIDSELALAPALIERTLAGTLQLVRDAKDSPLLPGERSQQFSLIEALQARGAVYQREFLQSLRRGVREAVDEQQNGPSGFGAGSGGLELMDESSVEADIEISRAMQLIDTTAEWELRELQTYTSTLTGQTHVSAESNPFRPQVYANALWDAACGLSPTPAHRTTVLRISAGVAAGLLKNAWAAATTRLEAEGVEPGAYRSVVMPAGSVPGRGPSLPDVNTGSALAGLLASMPGGSATMQVSVGNAAVAMGTAAQRAPMATSAEFEQAMARLEELLRHLPAVAAGSADAETLKKRLNAHRAALVGSARVPVERQAIELVSRVFDHMLSDAQLPAAFAPPIARLRGSALRVSLRDPEMLNSTRHAVWQLLDRIGSAAAAAPVASDPRTTTMLALCQALATQLANAANPDATLYRRALTQLDTLLTNQMQSQLQEAQPAVQSLHTAERRELLEQRLIQRLVDQVATVRCSPSVRRFVTGTWAAVLAESMLRHGDQGEITHGYIKLVDELLWSVQLPDHPKSRQRLVALLPSMLQRLRSGMEMIALPAAEQDAILDELMALHAEALRPNTRGEPAALTPEQIVQRMRDEVLPPSTGHGGFSDSVIDVASMETVPAELLPNDSASPAENAAQQVDALRPGDSLRLFLNGRWGRVQLLWRSDKGLFFLFAGEVAGRTHSVTRRALERLAGAGLMQPLEARPLVQRALDAVMRDAGRGAN